MAAKKKQTTKAQQNGHAVLAVAPAVVEIAKPVVVPAGAASIADTLPDVIALRCSYADASVEQLAVVARCFGMGRACDKRLELLTQDDLRGHRAFRIPPPRAALVWSGNPLVTLVVETIGHMGQTRDLTIRPVAAFFTDIPGELLRPPHRAEHELMSEAKARCIQVWEGLSDDETAGLFSPIDYGRLAATVAEAVTVEACMYALNSGSGVLWVKHRDLLWPVALVRGQALRQAEEPSNFYTAAEWNRRPAPL